MGIADAVLIAGAAPTYVGVELLYAAVGAAYVCIGAAVGAARKVADGLIIVVIGAAADVGVPAEYVIVGGAAFDE